MQQFKQNLENQVSSKNYRGWEKLEHETQMRIKAWAVEQSIYYLPALVVMMSYFLYGLIVEINLPFGQNFDFFSAWLVVWIIVSMVLVAISLKYFKPIFSQVMDKQIKEISEDVYLKGARFTSSVGLNQELDTHLQAEYEIEKNSKVFESFEIPLQSLTDEKDKRYEEIVENMKIPRISLATGLCIMGSPGKGKSVLINHLVAQIPSDENTKTVIIDVKGEFVEKFYNAETDYILCPADLRSVKFELRKLIKTHVDAGVIAEILVPDDKQTQDPHWTAAARAVMEGILIKAVKNRLTNREIFELISDTEKLAELKEDEDIKIIVGNYLRIDDAGRMDKETGSILSSLARKAKTLQYLKYLDDLEDNTSIEFKEWLNNGKGGKLFLLATDNLSRVFSPLYGVITSYLISSILDGTDNRNLNFYFILDELPRLGKALGENLEKALAVGRSKGIKIIMAMQSYSQIKKEFGEKESESILDTTNSYIIFQSNTGAQFLEKHFGKTTVLRNDESFSFGMDSMADRVTVSRKEVKEALIDDAEINRLKVFEFYAKIEGSSNVLKSRLAAKFVLSKGIEKYIENPKMTIEALDSEMRIVIQRIQNQFIDTLNVSARANLNKESVKIIM